MPFKSKKQRKWMWANKPELAEEWTKRYGSKTKATAKKRSKRKKTGAKAGK